MKPERSKIKKRHSAAGEAPLRALHPRRGASCSSVWCGCRLFSAEVAYNADRLSSRIFTEEVIPAQRGSILSRDGEPLATSIFRYQAAFDFASPGLDSLRTFREQADSLSKLLAAFFGDRPASEYARMFREGACPALPAGQSARHAVSPFGGVAVADARPPARRGSTSRGGFTTRSATIRPSLSFPREVDYAEWEVLRRYPLLNWNMGMVYRLVERDERIYPQGETGAADHRSDGRQGQLRH